jgi:predicted nucleic acid-binding protein
MTFAMQRVVISDSSCLIGLLNIGRLDLLQELYGEVWTTPQVIAEVGAGLPRWIIVQEASDKVLVTQLLASIDQGEATAIALATEFQDVVVILDDLDARAAAIRLGLELTGTLGVLLLAKQAGIILEIRSAIDGLALVGFRMSDGLRSKMLRMAGEE